MRHTYIQVVLSLDNEAWDMPTYMHTNVIYSRPPVVPIGSVDTMGWYNYS